MDRNPIDIERQEIHRESEGQDTITSLTNNQFIRAIEKLKRQESVRSNASQISAASLSASMRTLKKTASTETGSMTSVKSSNTGSLKQKIPKSLVSLFKSNEDKLNNIYYENFLNELSDHQQKQELLDKSFDSPNPQFKTQSSCISVTSTNSNYSTLKKSVNANKLNESLTSQKSINNKLVAGKDEGNTNEAKRVKLLQSASVISNQANTKTDEVFDALSVILKNQNESLAMENEFYQQLRLYILQSKLNRKKKLDKVKWFWSIAVYLFLFLIFLMVCYFIKTLYSIVDHINNNLGENYKSLFNRGNVLIGNPTSTEELLKNVTTAAMSSSIMDFLSTTPETFS